MQKLDFKYWNNEMICNFPHRAKLKDDNFFVLSYMMAPPPCNVLVHEIMNFSDFKKMVSFIRNIIVRRAVGDALDIDCDTAMFGDFDKQIEDFRKENEPTKAQEKAISMYYELEHLEYAPKAIAVEWLKDFRNRFESLFKRCATCIHGMELIFPEDDLVDFWTKFFMLDPDDEYDAWDIEHLQKALATSDTALLDELISNHC